MNRREFFGAIFLAPLALLSKPEETEMVTATPSDPIRIYLDGVDVSDVCTEAYVPREQGITYPGWCFILDMPARIGAGSELIGKRVYGLVSWMPL